MDFEADYLMSVKTLYENMNSKVIGIILYFVYGEHQAIGYITFSCTPTLFMSIILVTSKLQLGLSLFLIKSWSMIVV